MYRNVLQLKLFGALLSATNIKNRWNEIHYFPISFNAIDKLLFVQYIKNFDAILTVDIIRSANNTINNINEVAKCQSQVYSSRAECRVPAASGEPAASLLKLMQHMTTD